MPITHQAIIFDMDGVLVDSEPLHLAATNAVLAEEGASLSSLENRIYLGTNERAYWRALVERFGLRRPAEECMERKRAETHRRLREALPVAPGVRDFARAARARGLALGVASGSDRDLVEFVLSGVGIDDLVGAIAAGDEVGRPKPDPEIFLLAAERLGIDPEVCLVFEDSANGARAALAAGMGCVRVVTETTRGLDFPEVHGSIDSFVDQRVDDWIVRPIRGEEYGR
ncbi:MAG: HAD family phosphatase [Planctomycetota bacterium]